MTLALLRRALEWVGVSPTARMFEQFEQLGNWLITEARTAGGIGPGEAGRIESRHLADSVLFAGAWEAGSDGRVVDLGTGVGLPGLPLAIIFPQREFLLIDRSQRRASLAGRAVRVLDLPNVTVRREEIARVDWTDCTAVSRASLPLPHWRELIETKGRPRELLVAGSHQTPPQADGFEVVEIPAEILDRPVWILRMAQS